MSFCTIERLVVHHVLRLASLRSSHKNFMQESPSKCPGFRTCRETWGTGSTSNYCRPVLLGYGTMAGNLFPHAVLPDESIGTEHSLDAVFAPDHSIISIGIGRDRGVVVVDADFEIADLFTVHFIVGRVFCIRQYGFLRGPDSATEPASPIVGITLLEER